MKLATFRSSSTTRMRIRPVVHHPLRPVNAAHAILGAVVLDLSHLFQHFGYAAILVVVLLGNAGFPAPEESVLVLGGYLAWQHRLLARAPLRAACHREAPVASRAPRPGPAHDDSIRRARRLRVTIRSGAA